jgi:hypothetical protein
MYEVPFYIAFYMVALVLALLALMFLPDWINYPLFIGLGVLGPWMNYWRYKKMKDKYSKENYTN